MSNTRHKYTKEEKSFIIENYPKFGAEYCNDFLHIGSNKIQKWAIECAGLRLNKGVAAIISRKHTLSRNIEEKQKEYNKIFNFHENYVVYFWGLFWADGHLEKKTNRFGIGLQKDDAICLKNILEYIYGSIGKEKEAERYGKKTKNIITYRKSNHLAGDKLKELDFCQKSYYSPIKILSLIPKNKHYLFWRGYLDGDGSVCKIAHHRINSVQFASTFDNDWASLESFLRENLIDYKIIKTISKEGYKSSSLRITRIQNIINFFEILYPNKIHDGIGLIRKFNKFTQIKFKETRIERKPKINKDTGLYYIYRSRKSFVASIRKNNIFYRKNSKDINELIQFTNKICQELGRLEYLNPPVIQ